MYGSRKAVSSEGQGSSSSHQGTGEGQDWDIRPRPDLKEEACSRTMEDLVSIPLPGLIMRTHFLTLLDTMESLRCKWR